MSEDGYKRGGGEGTYLDSTSPLQESITSGSGGEFGARGGFCRTLASRAAAAAAAVAMVASVAVLLLAPSGAAAGTTPYGISFADDDFASIDPQVRQEAFDRAAAVGSQYVRISAGWRAIAHVQPEDGTDPGDPAYRFTKLDRTIEEATDRGLEPVLTVATTPNWAQGPDRPPNVGFGGWKPNPASYGQFARALATRYGGSYVPDGSPLGEPLPRVRFFEVWNEPQIPAFLSPQWDGKKPRSPEIYRSLLNAFYVNAHAVQPGVRVIAGGMNPYGNDPGGRRMRPKYFLRELLCIRHVRKLKARKRCPEPARFDILSDHPISPDRGPRRKADHPDEVAIGDLPSLERILRRAEAQGTTGGPSRHAFWVTEYWWETNPPDDRKGIPTLDQQARRISEAQMAFWEEGIKVAFYYQVADDPLPEDSPDKALAFQSGIYFRDGRSKPSIRSVRFPLAAERSSKRKLRVWLRPPANGRVRIQRKRGGSWKTKERVRGRASVPLERVLRVRGGMKLRAIVKGKKSYVYKQHR